MKPSCAIATFAGVLIIAVLSVAGITTGAERGADTVTAMTSEEFREASTETRFGYVAGMKDTMEFVANNSSRRVTRFDKAVADCIKLISVPRLQEIADRR